MDHEALERAMAYVGSWLRHRSETTDVPGFVVAVSHEGRMLLNNAYGQADLEEGTRLTPRHIFRIASHSKTFTATAVMQLVERKALHLDDPVVGHLPWLGAHRDPRFAHVTIRQLLSHGAGVIRDGHDTDHWQLLRPFPDLDEFRAAVLDADLVIDANTRLKYSNVGYTLVGLVIEAVSGKSYNAYVVEHIVEPLGLRRTGPEPPTTPAGGTAETRGRARTRGEVRTEAATGHGRAERARTVDPPTRRTIPPVDTRVMSAATGFYGTAEDLCACFTAQMVGSGRLLSDGSKREMQKVQWNAYQPGPGPHADYGLGLMLETVGARRTIGHGGGFPGQITRTMADPADGLVVVALTNCIDGPASEMARGVYRIIDHFQSHDAPERRSEALQGLAGRYANLWSVVDVVVAGDRVAVAEPGTWDPLGTVDVLVPVATEKTGPKAMAAPSSGTAAAKTGATKTAATGRADAAADAASRTGVTPDADAVRTLRITDTGSYGSEGELVHFALQDGRVTTVDYAGATLWPEHVWRRRRRRRPNAARS